MAQEIERKFLVKNTDFKKRAISSTPIVQAYISSHFERTVRVRIRGEKAFLTIKGKSNESGTSRFEWEKEIEIDDARELLKICEGGIIDKIRHVVNYGDHNYEVDVFNGDNQGLIIAEIELNSENEDFLKPSWLGEEVTGDKKYYNSELMKNPFLNWK